MNWTTFRNVRDELQGRQGLRATAVAVAVGGVVAVVGACAPAAPAGEAPVPSATSRPATQVDPSPSGSLRQDQISVRLTVGVLRIEVTPLAAWVLEAAAPDTRSRLARIAEVHMAEFAGRGSGDPVPLFLVSFSSSQPGTEFQPDDLHIVSRGLRERPLVVRAITPGWGSQRLSQQASAMAVYAYGDGVDLTRDLTVVYQGVEDSSWSNKVNVIEAERARIRRQ